MRPLQTNPGAVILAGLLLATVTGCQSVDSGFRHRLRHRERSSEELTQSKDKDGVVRTDFKREVKTEQQVGVHIDLGRLYETEGQDEAAVAEYQKALDAVGRPGRPGLLRGGPKALAQQKSLAHRRMAQALDRLGRFAQAEAHYRDALQLSPDDSKVWNSAGYSYYLQGRWPDAERCLKTAAKIEPANPQIQTNLGLALAAAGKEEAALEALTKAAGPAVGHANLGYILASMGRDDAARQHYRAALAIQPQLLAAQAALAQLGTDASSDTAAPDPNPVIRASATAEVPHRSR